MNSEFPFNHFFKTLPNNAQKKSPVINTLEIQKHPGPKPLEKNLEILKDEIMQRIKSAMEEQTYNSYFKGNMTLGQLKDDQAVFYVTDPFVKATVEKYYLDAIKAAVKDIAGSERSVVLQIAPGQPKKGSPPASFLNLIKEVKAAPVNAPQNPSNRFSLNLNETDEDLLSSVESQYIDHMNSKQIELHIDPDKTFDNFIIDPFNQLTVAAASSVADCPGKDGKYPCLYIHGNSGLGKTHLLHAVANKVKKQHPDLAICLITARSFMKEMIQAIQLNKSSEFQKKYSETVDFLMIDDIHELKGKPGTQNEFFHTFNELYNQGKQLIFTSDKSPKAIDRLEERIKTRLQWGLVMEIQRPEFETRIAILKKKAHKLDLFLNDDAFTLIASNITSSIRELEGALIKLSAYSDMVKESLDIEMIKTLLDLESAEKADHITIESIAKASCQYFKISLADLRSRVRNKDIVRIRSIAMYLSRDIINATFSEIAQFYGGRNHTSAIHGITRISEQLKKDDELSRDLLAIKGMLL